MFEKCLLNVSNFVKHGHGLPWVANGNEYQELHFELGVKKLRPVFQFVGERKKRIRESKVQ